MIVLCIREIHLTPGLPKYGHVIVKSRTSLAHNTGILIGHICPLHRAYDPGRSNKITMNYMQIKMNFAFGFNVRYFNIAFNIHIMNGIRIHKSHFGVA